MIEDNCDPKFEQGVEDDFKFEERQLYRVKVYHAKDKKNLDKLENQQHIGRTDFTLQEIINTEGWTMQKELGHTEQNQGGKIVIKGRKKEVAYGKTAISFDCSIEIEKQQSSLDQTTFLLFNRQNED